MASTEDLIADYLAKGGSITCLPEKDPKQAQADFYEARRNRMNEQVQRYKRRGR